MPWWCKSRARERERARERKSAEAGRRHITRKSIVHEMAACEERERTPSLHFLVSGCVHITDNQNDPQPPTTTKHCCIQRELVTTALLYKSLGIQMNGEIFPGSSKTKIAQLNSEAPFGILISLVHLLAQLPLDPWLCIHLQVPAALLPSVQAETDALLILGLTSGRVTRMDLRQFVSNIQRHMQLLATNTKQ